MEKAKDGGPAFPCRTKRPFGEAELYTTGISMRDYFAGQALAGLLADPTTHDMTQDAISGACFSQADSMIRIGSKEIS